MNEKAGRIFRIADENMPIPGCTVSRAVSAENGYYISHFALAGGTDISAEIYRYPKLWLVESGDLRPVRTGPKSAAMQKRTEIIADTESKGLPVPDPEVKLQEGNLYVTPVGIPIGAASRTGTVYTEISLREDTKMNSILKAGEVMALKDLLPYQEGRIINMDLINEEHLKLVVMSFDAGTGLAEHAAPGEALIFALDGEAIIGYEGGEYRIKAGENFKFDKGGAHSVTADHRFKMALLLTV